MSLNPELLEMIERLSPEKRGEVGALVETLLSRPACSKTTPRSGPKDYLPISGARLTLSPSRSRHLC